MPEFCTKMGKYVVVQSTQMVDCPGFLANKGQVTFLCVTKDDPEYTRQHLQPRPDTVIQDAR